MNPENGGTLFVANKPTTGHKIMQLGSVYKDQHPPMSDIYLGDTTVVISGPDTYRAVAVEENGVCNLYALTAENEESLILQAVVMVPDLKTSWTRWATIAKTNTYPQGATEMERAVFGPHCMLSTTLVAQRDTRKRARDMVSRNKRKASATPDGPPKPLKVIKPAPSESIRLTLEIPASATQAVALVRSALQGMADAMPL